MFKIKTSLVARMKGNGYMYIKRKKKLKEDNLEDGETILFTGRAWYGTTSLTLFWGAASEKVVFCKNDPTSRSNYRYFSVKSLTHQFQILSGQLHYLRFHYYSFLPIITENLFNVLSIVFHDSIMVQPKPAGYYKLSTVKVSLYSKFKLLK